MNVIRQIMFFYDYVRPVLDVLILAYILYKVFDILVKNQALQLLKGGAILLSMYGLALFFKLNTVVWIFNIMGPGLIIGIAIVFQQELRKIFFKIGQGNWIQIASKTKIASIESVITASEILSEKRRGMLLVFSRKSSLKEFVDSGTKLSADISSSLIVTIFGHDTPLHDGAVIVTGDKIVAAGCFLPLSMQQDIKKTFGTRHRAALGLSEITDSIVLIVSEETGAISLAYDSKIYYDLNSSDIKTQLSMLLTDYQDSVSQEASEYEN